MKAFLIELIGISLPVSIVILLLLVFLKAIKKNFRASSRFIIWLVIIIRLAIPFGGIFLPSIIEIPVYETSVITPEENHQPSTPSKDPILDTGIADVPGQIISDLENTTQNAPATEAETFEENEKSFSFDRSMIVPLLFFMWSAGACAFILTDMIRYNVFCTKMKRSLVPAESTQCSIYDNLCAEMGIKHPPMLYKSSLSQSPVLCGYFKKIIIIPDISLSEDALRSILKHELTHHVRGDVWMKLLARFANAIHWFNPIVYPAVSQFNREMELSCDEKVIHSLSDEERVFYGKTMLDIVQSCRDREAILTTKFNPNKKAASERIENILNAKKKKNGIIFICITIALCIFVGTVIGFKVFRDNNNRDDIPPQKTEDTTGSPSKDEEETTGPADTTAPDESANNGETADSTGNAQNEDTAKDSSNANNKDTTNSPNVQKGDAIISLGTSFDSTSSKNTEKETTAKTETTKKEESTKKEETTEEIKVPINEEEQLALAQKYLREGKHTQAYNALWLIRNNEIAAKMLEDFIAIPTKGKKTESGNTKDLNIVTVSSDNSITVNLPDPIGPNYEGVPYIIGYNINCKDNNVFIKNIRSDNSGNTKEYTFNNNRDVTLYKFGSTKEVFEYDSNGYLTKRVWNDHQTDTYHYDDNGNLIKVVKKSWHLNNTIEYTYSDDGKLLTRTKNGSVIERREYDSQGRLIADADYQYSYKDGFCYKTYTSSGFYKCDMKGNTLEEWLSGTLLAEYTYNSAGQLTSMQRYDVGTPWCICKYVKMEYDGNGRLKRVEKMTTDGEIIIAEYSDYGMYYIPDDDTAYYIQRTIQLNYR